jgi:alkanesulfonate monooxygenase SsuD/methylene tetrahydromethanopterin reductase-like flavin-dependent oxidoreductase (luciferase family)
MTLKLDVFYEFQPKRKPWVLPHPYGQRDAEQQTYREAIAQIQYADKLGFETAWVVEHHFREERSVAATPEAILGGLALSTDRIRLGFGVVLMPFGFTHPVRVAEKVATVDIMSNGRVEWGTGRSTPMEQVGFGVPVGPEGREQWREAIEIVVRMWEEESLSWNSPNFQMPERIVGPKPLQDPHPPCWVAASSEASSFNAGKYGLGLLLVTQVQPIEKCAAAVRTYRQAQQECTPLTRVRNDRVGCMTLVHCYEDPDEAEAYGAWESVRWWYQNIAEHYLKWEVTAVAEADRPDNDAIKVLFPLLEAAARGEIDVAAYQDADMIIVGTPQECLRKILRYEEAGVDQVLCYQQFGILPHEKVMRSMELMNEEIIPVLEARGHRPTAVSRPVNMASTT